MDDARAARLHAWLERAAADDLVDRATLDGLRSALGSAAGRRDLVALGPHGTAVCFAPGAPRRRVLEFDRAGVLSGALRWTPHGALRRAWLRIPDGSWLAIEPRATADAPWGVSDRLCHAVRPSERLRTPLTVFAALDYARIDHIPPLAEPARLPPGGGTAVLNLVAALAADQGRGRLAYRGPYPTEQLFLALLEAFRYEAGADDPLRAFVAGGLAWTPAPHERVFTPDGPYVQLRGRIEKVVWRGRAYYRPDWQGVRRRAPHRLDDVREGVRCAVWALETVVEEHLVLSPDGEVARAIETAPAPDETGPIPAVVWAGVVAAVAARSAPALAPFIRAVADGMAVEWGPLAGDLVAVDGGRVRVSSRLRRLAAQRLGAAPAQADRAAIALATLAELATLVGDALRARAQARVAALAPAAQPGALAPAEGSAEAREIVEAVDALARELAEGPARAEASGGRVHDHPDVQRDEGGHRHG